MLEVTESDFAEYRVRHGEVCIAGKLLPLWVQCRDCVNPPPTQLESTTVWSFPDRGSWATHNGNYRGNWSPHVVRNIVQRYTRPGDLVLDQMMGCGTTLIECRLLGRNSIGVDINPDAVMLARAHLHFPLLGTEGEGACARTYIGDAQNLTLVEDDSVDLVASRPPYSDAIPYSGGKVANDISDIRDRGRFIDAMSAVAEESYRVLKPGRTCSILIGDTRRRTHYVPLSAWVMEAFLEAVFLLKEDIIKIQWNTASSLRYPFGPSAGFYNIAHEHLYIFRKPTSSSDLRTHIDSASWRVRT